jgi:uncharacterized protein YndB with AHSA1/START domain
MSNPTESAPSKVLTKEAVVTADLDAVWRAWTTEDGLKFVSGRSKVELKAGGAYEWFLDLEPDERGRRGGQGSHFLAILPKDMIVFAWTFPPTIPTLRYRDAMTQVVVRFSALADAQTRVRMDVGGWQEGDDWQRGREYFDQAWDLVLSRLAASFEGDASAQ